MRSEVQPCKAASLPANTIANMREDFCHCEKKPGSYGRGPFHLRATPGCPDCPSRDVVVEKCPAWQNAVAQIRDSKKRIREIDALLAKQDSDRTVASLLAERDSNQDQIESWLRRMERLKGNPFVDEDGS